MASERAVPNKVTMRSVSVKDKFENEKRGVECWAVVVM